MPTDTRLDDQACYRALAARDRRFDGSFFVGVTSTGIYCRPVCPARTPRVRNCRFFVSAAAAERRGFRPCLRCRPELAPHDRALPGVLPSDRTPDRVPAPVATVDAVTIRAHAAGARIASGALDAHSVPALAEALGTSPRQLRRVVTGVFGASPVALAQTRRLLTAKQLLTESPLSMGQVALASGFGSVRRFNALFQSRYGLAPRELQARSRHQSPHHRSPNQPSAHRGPDHLPPDVLQLTLGLRPPYDWGGVCAFLARRAMPGVEHVHTGNDGAPPAYARSISWGGHRGTIRISAPLSDTGAAVVESFHTLRADISDTLLPVLVPLLAQLREFLDLDASPDVIGAHLADDPLLRGAVERTPGRRVPGAMDGFELAVRAVLGQQVSVRGASTLAGRLVQALAEPLTHATAENAAEPVDSNPAGAPRLTHLPLTAERVAGATVEQIAAIGIPRARAGALQALARAVADGDLPWLAVAGASVPAGAGDVGAFLDAFTALPGIGPWTAQYVAMRALHAPDAFPDGDLALRKAAGGLSSAQLRHRAEQWRPWRAYAAMHLWASLAEE